MHSETTVNGGTVDAEEYAICYGRPRRILGWTIEAYLARRRHRQMRRVPDNDLPYLVLALAFHLGEQPDGIVLRQNVHRRGD